MMFGLREEFTYQECAACGCLRLLDVPNDLAPYYPDSYYAFDPPAPRLYSRLHRLLRKQKQSYCLGAVNPVGWLLSRRQPPDVYLQWLIPAHIRFESAILDVGCGAGHFLRELKRDGFTRLTGADPYLREEIHEPGLNTYRQHLSEMTGTFDLIILNHAFEHMSAPGPTLQQMARLLNPGGYACLRIPVADSYAWRTYGVDWFQLDAPRHLYLHTRRSIELLAAPAGLTLEKVVYDSFENQFTGSECYRRDIPFAETRHQGIFTPEEIAAFRERAAALNAEGDGDQACFYLRKNLL